MDKNRASYVELTRVIRETEHSKSKLC